MSTMRILYLCEGSSFAGSDRYLLTLIKELENNSDLELFCAFFYDGPIIAKLRKHHIKMVPLNGRSNLQSIKSLIDHIKSNHIDIVHFIDFKAIVIGSLSLPFLRKLESFATVHGLPEFPSDFVKKAKYGISLLLYYIFIRFIIKHIVCVSFDLKKYLIRLLHFKNINVIHNGIILESYQPAKNKSTKDHKKRFIIGTIGRLEWVKGHDVLLQAAKLMDNEKIPANFLIVGNGPLRHLLDTMSRSLKINDRIYMPGFVSNIKSIYDQIDIFVLPSRHEGIPFVLLEAMCFQKPVICSKVGGIKEVIEHNIDGILVPPENSHVLKEKIVDLMKDRRVSNLLAENARKKIRSKFSSKAFAQKTVDLYSSKIGSKPN